MTSLKTAAKETGQKPETANEKSLVSRGYHSKKQSSESMESISSDIDTNYWLCKTDPKAICITTK